MKKMRYTCERQYLVIKYNEFARNNLNGYITPQEELVRQEAVTARDIRLLDEFLRSAPIGDSISLSKAEIVTVLAKTIIEFEGNLTGCCLTYQDNILRCAKHDNFEGNYKTAMQALELLLGFEFSDDQFKEWGGKVERYRITAANKS